MFTIQLHSRHENFTVLFENREAQGKGLDIQDTNALGIDEQKTREYADKIIQILDKNPEVSTAVNEAFSGMSNEVLKSPENVKKILEKIQDSPTLDNKKKPEIMLTVMSRHAVVIEDISLARRLTELSNSMDYEQVQTLTRGSAERLKLRNGLRLG